MNKQQYVDTVGAFVRRFGDFHAWHQKLPAETRVQWFEVFEAFDVEDVQAALGDRRTGQVGPLQRYDWDNFPYMLVSEARAYRDRRLDEERRASNRREIHANSRHTDKTIDTVGLRPCLVEMMKEIDATDDEHEKKTIIRRYRDEVKAGKW